MARRRIEHMSDHESAIDADDDERTAFDHETIDLADEPRDHAAEPWPVPATEPEEPHRFWEPPAEPRASDGRGGTRAIALFLAALLGAAVGGGGAYVALDGGRGVATVRVSAPVDGDTSTAPADAAARVAEVVLPSIVQIDVAGTFGASGLGSGVIYSSEGYIITNDHVISGADAIQVNLPDGTVLPAAIVGTARNTGIDIAVLKVVPPEPLTAATFGSSRDLRVGELAVAIGSPFGFQSTVTAGIISALNRNETLPGGVRFMDAIQTDAAINQGNSGGALANADGEVIGVNTAIISETGGNVGLGFAIPIDIVRKVADQIIQEGTARLPVLGISGDSLAGGEGARVREVEPGSGAADAGLQVGDVIVSFDGEDVSSMDQLISLILEKDVGDSVPLEILRDGRRISLTATLGAR